MTPFFSVILPTYNRAHLISRAAESVLRQSFTDWELIIIDDGSTDDTRDRVAEFARSDNRIRYFYTSNRGPALARNYGSSLARGKYFAFLDSDDEYLPDHLALRYDVIGNTPAVELLHGGVEIVGDEYVADRFDTSKKIHISDCIVGGTFVIRRDLWARLGGFHDIAYGDDNDFYSRALDHGAYIEKVNYPTYRYYRTESDSLCAIVEREGIEGIRRSRASSGASPE